MRRKSRESCSLLLEDALDHSDTEFNERTGTKSASVHSNPIQANFCLNFQIVSLLRLKVSTVPSSNNWEIGQAEMAGSQEHSFNPLSRNLRAPQTIALISCIQKHTVPRCVILFCSYRLVSRWKLAPSITVKNENTWIFLSSTSALIQGQLQVELTHAWIGKKISMVLSHRLEPKTAQATSPCSKIRRRGNHKG